MTATEPLLIVANWGRPLAQSAWRAGIEVVVLDLFADVDTQRYARRAQAVALPNSLELDIDYAAAAAQRLAGDCKALVYGAGFEKQPELIERVAAGRRIVGNTPATVRAVKHPATFFPLLAAIGMPHPETLLQRPADPHGWLAKTTGAQAGGHIVPLETMDAGADDATCYYQRRIDGVPHSVLFLADGKNARIIGFNEQLTHAIGAASYWYAGAVGNVSLPTWMTSDIATRLNRLVRQTNLIGLNSLDFMRQGERYYVLEINPRPSATMDLYDEQAPGGVLAWHIAACKGELVSTPLPAHALRGHAVVYAEQPSHVPEAFTWPTWCSDVDTPGARITPGVPVCMVHAQGSTPAAVKQLLSQRSQAVLNALG